ncbi:MULTISPECIES: hypothetical protein [unclassified Crossiella]|uniref:hypothetical protein n=1 Tax=unclassified Crossiella TaxID=2620835 RepID=UPI001FFF8373|nr:MULTISPECIES: hypothetical protein [unclassified Crossiella]MCK2242475.1 hypothetical protein [Crossiella sp. S99.2]MCK2254495.1 hypothetical protein [Crossiella sp. S99.1]
MGIELELHSQRPSTRSWKSSRATLLRGSYDHGYDLADALATLRETDPGKLPWIDPCGNTQFNEQEAEAARHEIPALLAKCTTPEQSAAVRDLDNLLRDCAHTPGSYLWFVGD